MVAAQKKVTADTPELYLVLVGTEQYGNVSNPDAEPVQKREESAERDILFRERKQTFPFVAQFHALQGFQPAVHDRAPSHRQIPSHHAVPHRPIRRVRIGVATMVDILPAHGQPCRGDGYSCILVPDNPCPFGMYRRIQKVYIGGIDYSGGLVRVVTE